MRYSSWAVTANVQKHLSIEGKHMCHKLLHRAVGGQYPRPSLVVRLGDIPQILSLYVTSEVTPPGIAMAGMLRRS
jgi:hypothetical protein